MAVPKLRFKDDNGADYPEWEMNTIDDIATIIGGGTPSTENKDFWNGNIQWFTPVEISTKYVKESKRTITNEGLKKSSAKELPKYTILLTTRASIGLTAINISDKIVTTNQGFQSLVCKKGFYYEFIYYLINTTFVQNELNLKASGSTFTEISSSNVKKIKVSVPCLEEQRKIADFLTTFDKRITAQQNIIADMEETKKGLLQKIFSQEIRFKNENGEDYPAWEKKKFKNVFSSLDYGMNCSAKEYDGKNKYIRITDIDDSTGKYLVSNIVSPDGELDDKFLVNDGDILFARTGASTGKTYLYNESDGKLYFAGFLIRGHVIEQYNSYFIFIITFTKHYKNWLKVMSMRSGQPGVNSKEYSEYSFICPCLEEQNKIASFLSTYDKKLEAEKKILADLQEMKKGLLQQMFI